MKRSCVGFRMALALSAGVLVVSLPCAAAGGASRPVEEIVARVNNKIITTSDLVHAREQLATELRQNPGPNVDAQIEAQQKDLLRDLIDQQLLLQRADDLGKSAETETVKRLDEIRRSMNLPSAGEDGMDELRKAVETQGQDFEDFKQSIRNSILTQKVIEEDVAPRIQITPEAVQAYYNAHKKDFVREEEVGLSEILISTKDKPQMDQAKLKKLADEVQARAAKGENFAKLAQRYSGGQTAESGGGYIGFFKQGSLAPELEKVVFKLGEGEVTPVLNTANGYLILKVDSIHHAGQQTPPEARQEIEYRLYQQKLQPELRHYLGRMRSEAYIVIKPGYSDTGRSETASVNIERFERVLPQDMPKPVEKPNKGGLQ